MSSIQPRVGQFVRPGPGWANRPWCKVTEVSTDRSLGDYFVAEYPDECPDPSHQHEVTAYRQYERDHNFRFCEVADSPGPLTFAVNRTSI